MPESSPENKQLIGIAPFLFVSDVKKSADYYRDCLGFDYKRFWGEPPSFCMVNRDGFILMLSQSCESEAVRPNSSVDGESWSAYIWIQDAEALFNEFKSRGAQFAYEPLIREYYQIKEFAICDPDGHVIAFGQHWPIS